MELRKEWYGVYYKYSEIVYKWSSAHGREALGVLSRHCYHLRSDK